MSKISAETGLSIATIHRHKQHISSMMVPATRAREAADAQSLLDRVENLISQSQTIAVQAQKKKEWRAATMALREVRGCLELLARLSGELQAATNVSLHRHLHIEAQSALPRTAEECDREVAEYVRQGTLGFNLDEFYRLKALLEPGTVLDAAEYESSASLAAADTEQLVSRS
ncbi:MAG: hypothetical protein ABSD75_28960 [Terriglobales bacterium]